MFGMEEGISKAEFSERAGAVKLRVQMAVVAVGALLMCAKFAAFLFTNSAAILTDAMESIVNVAAGLVSLYGIRLASRPKDSDHPFGHGKIELVSASVEGLLILAAGVAIVCEGAARLISPAEIERLDMGLAVVALAGAANFLMGSVSIHFGRKYGSMALIAGGKHLHSDTYSTIGLVAGLLAVSLTGAVWIDSAVAVLFGLLIISAGVGVLRKTIANLTDEADEGRLKKLLKTVSDYRENDWIDVHNLKVISYGSDIFVDCDLTMPFFYTIERGHEVSESLKAAICGAFEGNVLVSIHFDSCARAHCSHCELSDCRYRREPFSGSQSLTMREITGSDEFMSENKI